MQEIPSQQPEVFNVYMFVQKLQSLEDQLSEVIQKLEQAMKNNEEENIATYIIRKAKLTHSMFKHLAHAFNISNGDVCRLPQFNPNNPRYYIQLSLPCSPKFLWREVEEWLANEDSPETQIAKKEIIKEESPEVQVTKGQTLEDAFRTLLTP